MRYWTIGVGDMEDIYGCRDGDIQIGWCNGGGRRGQEEMETDS